MKRFTKLSYYMILVVVILTTSILTSCGSGKQNEGNNGNGSDNDNVDVVLDSRTISLDDDGGAVLLSDGTKLTVPAGAIIGATTLSLKKLSYPQDFGSGSLAYEITGLNHAASAVILIFNAEKALTTEEVNVVRYDIDTHEAAEIPYTYSPATGSVDVTIDPTHMTNASITGPSTLSPSGVPRVTEASLDFTHHIATPLYQGLWETIRILFTPTRSYVPNEREQFIQMPYYQQVGGSCWAADVMMLLRGYSVTSPRVHLGKVIRAGGVPDTDFGISATAPVLNELLRYIVDELSYASVQTTGNWRGFVDMQHMRWEVLRQLEKGHPVILLYPGHAVLVIGYRDYGDTWILQDSKAQSPINAVDGGMYTVRPWSWIRAKQTSPSRVAQIMWLDTAPVTNRTLNTIGLPGGDETTGCPFGEFWFYQTNPRTGSQVPVAQLQFRPSKIDGYRWQSRSDDIEVIPNTATNVSMRFPLWNAAFNTTQVTVQTEVFTGSNRLFQQSYNFSLPSAAYNTTATTEGNFDIPMEQIRRLTLAGQDGTQKITMEVKLQEGSIFLDGFLVEATISVKPRIRELTPTSSKPGDVVTIEGSSFGTAQSAKSAVFIGGKIAQIVSWSENEITAKVPQDVASGEVQVIVTTGEQYLYESNSYPLTIAAGSAIDSLTPNKGAAGTEMSISGSGFGTTQGSGTVTFNGTAATQVVSWSDTQIKVKVPNGATTGPVVVKRDGLNSNAVTFTVEGPQIKIITGQIDKQNSFTLPWYFGEYEQVVTIGGDWSLAAAGALLISDSGSGGSLSIAQNNQATLTISNNSALKETGYRYDWYYEDGYTMMTWNDPKLVNREDSYSIDGLTCTISVSDHQANVQFSFSSDEAKLFVQLDTEAEMAWVDYDNDGNEVNSGVETFVFGAAYFEVEPA